MSQDRTSAPAADSGWLASDKVWLSLRLITAALVAAAGYVHLQEWNDLLRAVPKIGPLFLANVVASAAVALLLVFRGRLAGFAAAILLEVGTLGGFLIARYGTLFGYSEPAWRTSAVVSAVLEVGAVILASVAIVVGVRRRDTRL